MIRLHALQINALAQPTSYGGLSINGGAGMVYFIKEDISINAGLSYTNGKIKDKEDDNQDFFSATNP